MSCPPLYSDRIFHYDRTSGHYEWENTLDDRRFRKQIFNNQIPIQIGGTTNQINNCLNTHPLFAIIISMMIGFLLCKLPGPINFLI